MRAVSLIVLLMSAVLLSQAPSPQTAQPSTPAQTAKPAPPATRPATPATRPAAPARGRGASPAPRPTTAKPAAPAVLPLTTDEQKTIYALGLAIQRSIVPFDLSAAELEILKRAMTDAAAGKPAVDLDEWGPHIDPLVSARRERVATRERAASVAYLAKAAGEVGAVRTDSGLVYREITAGTGASPTAADRVRVHYRGTLINGTEFDSSIGSPEPPEFALSAVIPCWTEGVQRMKTGGKARLVCPSDLAYGDTGTGPIAAGATLVFEIELIDIAQ